MKTIAALSTANATSAIAMLRLSGDKAAEIASAVFLSKSQKPLWEMKGYSAAYGDFYVDGEIIDDGVAIVYKAPKSYTGENMVELCCHGNIYIAGRILTELIKNGAVSASAGEFTKRAFLNGKMDLSQAEAVGELIAAEGECACRQALLRREGKLGKQIDSISDKLLECLSSIGAWCDYPEEDEVPFITDEALELTLSLCRQQLEKIAKGYCSGHLIDKGIKIAVAGSPNVGKSTLSNLLWQQERSIVTDIAGTTRDVVEGEFFINGVRLILLDTAGIRKTGDTVEKIGVERSKKAFGSADLILMVLDCSREISHEDKELLEQLKDMPHLVVLNKSDEKRADAGLDGIEISALTGEGTERLKEEILNKLEINLNQDTALIASQRQFECVNRALNSIDEARQALSLGVTLDAVSVLIDDALSPLLELTGRSVTEEVTDRIFKNFCVGK